MIEDKKLGLKVAESKEESRWINTRDECERMINEIIPKSMQQLEHELEVNKLVLEAVKKKIK